MRLKNRSENENGNEHQEVKNEGRNAQKMEVPTDFPPVEKSKLDLQGPVPTGKPGYLNGPAPMLSPKRQQLPIPTCHPIAMVGIWAGLQNMFIAKSVRM